MLPAAPVAFEPFEEGDAFAEERQEAAFEMLRSSTLGAFEFSRCDEGEHEPVLTGAGRCAVAPCFAKAPLFIGCRGGRGSTSVAPFWREEYGGWGAAAALPVVEKFRASLRASFNLLSAGGRGGAPPSPLKKGSARIWPSEGRISGR